MAVVLKWRGDEFLKLVDKQIVAGLYAAAVELHRIARKKAGIANAGQTVQQKNVTEGSNKTSRTIYPNSSKPGESPRRRTGFGQKNIVFGVDKATQTARVGFTRNARYMTFHELGIRYANVGLQQRPTIVPATSENLPRLQAVFQRGAKQVKL